MVKHFSYKALDLKNNKTLNGKIEATSEIAVEQLLADSNLVLIEAKEIKESFLVNLISSKKITPKELITLFITLEQYEHAGVPLLDSLKDLATFSENPKMKSMMQNIYEMVKNGDLLSSAMSKFANVFNEVNISLVEMGEKTGSLEMAFRNIYTNLKWNIEMKSKTMKAVKGPVMSLLMLVGVAVLLLKVVVPKVLGFILEQDIPIPSYTTALINTSNYVQNNFFMILGIVTGTIILTKILLHSSRNFRIKFDRIKLSIPMLGQVMKKLDISKFTKFFGITFSSGIPVLKCIEIANNVVVNRYLKNEIEYIKTKVSEGRTISKCIEDSDVFPFIVKRMFKVGEESGNIETAMDNIQYFYNTEINDSIDKVVASLKPLIMFVMGGLMVWIIAAVFGPIYGNFSNIV